MNKIAFGLIMIASSAFASEVINLDSHGRQLYETSDGRLLPAPVYYDLGEEEVIEMTVECNGNYDAQGRHLYKTADGQWAIAPVYENI